jgi:hypothetical protein
LNDDNGVRPASSAIPVASPMTHDSSPSTDDPSRITHDASSFPKLRAVLLLVLHRTRQKAFFSMYDTENVLRAVNNELFYRYGRQLVPAGPRGRCRRTMGKELRQVADELVRDGLVQDTSRLGYRRLKSLAEPDAAALSEEERGIVDSALSAHLDRKAGHMDRYPESERPGQFEDEDDRDDDRDSPQESGPRRYGTAVITEFFRRSRWGDDPKPGNPVPQLG